MKDETREYIFLLLVIVLPLFIAFTQGDKLGYRKNTGLITMTYEDSKGNDIMFYQYSYDNFIDVEEALATFYEEVLNPHEADKIRDCSVSNYNAAIYKKNERSYLLWQPYEYTILMISYDADVVEEQDIIKMAETCDYK